MEIRQNLRTVPSRPVVVVIAILAVLALAVTAWYALAAGPRTGAGSGQTVTSGFPGPDAQERNQRLSQPEAEANHGH